MWYQRASATTKSSVARESVKALAAIGLVGLVLLIAFAVFVGVGIAGMAAMFDFDQHERKHLAPMLISARACPSVESIHQAANDLQIAYPVIGSSYDAKQRPLTWPQTRERLRRAANRFEFAIVAGTTQFPVRVQRYLAAARDDVVVGRRHLIEAHDAPDFFNRTRSLFEHGQRSLGYAGDLVGRRCRVELQADPDTFLYPLLTTTTAPRRGSPNSAES
jgi:hypothetical protein